MTTTLQPMPGLRVADRLDRIRHALALIEATAAATIEIDDLDLEAEAPERLRALEAHVARFSSFDQSLIHQRLRELLDPFVRSDDPRGAR
jgi:hypothetical protein